MEDLEKKLTFGLENDPDIKNVTAFENVNGKEKKIHGNTKYFNDEDRKKSYKRIKK